MAGIVYPAVTRAFLQLSSASELLWCIFINMSKTRDNGPWLPSSEGLKQKL